MLGHGLCALERLPAFFASVLVCWHDSEASFSVHLPTTPQTILPRIIFISSNEKARSVWERTLPRERGRGLVVRRLADRKDVVLTERPIKVFDRDAALLSHLLEVLRPADPLIREPSEHLKVAIGILLYGHPPSCRRKPTMSWPVRHVNHHEPRGAAAASKLLQMFRITKSYQTKRAISCLSLPMPDVK
jgi:hypothetical protein